jgi:hypothetical protein
MDSIVPFQNRSAVKLSGKNVIASKTVTAEAAELPWISSPRVNMSMKVREIKNSVLRS